MISKPHTLITMEFIKIRTKNKEYPDVIAIIQIIYAFQMIILISINMKMADNHSDILGDFFFEINSW